MMKADIVRSIARETGLTQTKVSEVYDSLINYIGEALASGDRVRLKIGTLKPTKRAARTGRNPKTGEIVEIPERWTVVFTPSKQLKVKLNAKKKG